MWYNIIIKFRVKEENVMAKVAFSKLGLKQNNEVKILHYTTMEEVWAKQPSLLPIMEKSVVPKPQSVYSLTSLIFPHHH